MKEVFYMARPQFEPSEEHRRSVQTMAGYGIPEDVIARTIGPKGIDPKTLRKHFRRELLLGSTWANAQVAKTLFQMATSADFYQNDVAQRRTIWARLYS
jgi:hypothetical protein